MQTLLIVVAVIYIVGGCCAVWVEESLHFTHKPGRMARRFLTWPINPMWAIAITFPRDY